MTSRSNRQLTHSARTTVAIIGGGASGLIAAVQLIQRAPRAIKIVFVEPRASLGSGVAYSTEFDSHLLNVPAGNMSAIPDDPDHFFRWVRTNVARNFDRRSFARRSLYGNYLGETLAEACLLAKQQISLDHYRSRATHLETNRCGARVWMENGLRISADRVVLALGNPPQENPMPAGSGIEPVSAWSPSAFENLEPDGSVLLVGAGLTAVDTVLALDERGHRGTIHVVSRHGKWPLVMAHRLRRFIQVHRGPQLPCDPFCARSASRPPPLAHGRQPSTPCGRTPTRSGRVHPSASASGFTGISVSIGRSIGIGCRRKRPRRFTRCAGADECSIIPGASLRPASKTIRVFAFASRCGADATTFRLEVARIINCTGPSPTRAIGRIR